MFDLADAAPRPSDATDATTLTAPGYAKGEAARNRILQAALGIFGDHGFKGATTRQIAVAAGVNLPALQYYFGGKDGLYHACAQDIVARYQQRMLPLVAGVHAELGGGMTADTARARLKQVMAALAAMLVEAEGWSAFVMRELAERGSAFAILYEQLWGPGIALTAGLVARARGAPAPLRDHHIQALLLISSLSAFSTSRPVSLQYLDWDDISATGFRDIMRVVESQIDAL